MSPGIWPAVLGRFDWHALSFVRAWENPSINVIVGAGAASVVVVGAVSAIVTITLLGKWKALWSEWLTSLDHKKIGIMYIVIAFVMLARALVEGVLMRMQQASAINAPGIVAPEHFGELFQHPWQHHDLFHGDALPYGRDQLCNADADRQPRRCIPAAQLDQSMADGRRRGTDDGLARHRPVLHRRAGAATRLTPSWCSVLASGPTTGSGQ